MKLLGTEIGAAPRDRGRLGRLLERNADLRDVFAGEPALARRLSRLQQWQSKRLLRSHGDLQSDARFRLAVRFFVHELYGASNARRRDADLIKVQRAMERLLPREGLEALCLAIELETLSQDLDAAMTRALPAAAITTARYATAYREVGRRTDRERQIRLMVLVGEYLDGVVRRPMVRTLTRLARAPAYAAGFGLLQDFLERGLAAFEAMGDATDFLQTIQARETLAMTRLYAGAPDPFGFEASGHRRGKATPG